MYDFEFRMVNRREYYKLVGLTVHQYMRNLSVHHNPTTVHPYMLRHHCRMRYCSHELDCHRRHHYSRYPVHHKIRLAVFEPYIQRNFRRCRFQSLRRRQWHIAAWSQPECIHIRRLADRRNFHLRCCHKPLVAALALSSR